MAFTCRAGPYVCCSQVSRGTALSQRTFSKISIDVFVLARNGIEPPSRSVEGDSAAGRNSRFRTLNRTRSIAI
ncbi:hypothetical protein EVAR_83487_1 [Eumeta japonica]|uniref:Uncharacterized protein n=1 Tax=Eumeta variegata TaxID=151549 RepID=A0A4C1ZGG8_EUMVA|nr:hypothetical protein EVAR_83487_1 [Eumeta japonica]